MAHTFVMNNVPMLLGIALAQCHWSCIVVLFQKTLHGMKVTQFYVSIFVNPF
jgi:hypothetical protein